MTERSSWPRRLLVHPLGRLGHALWRPWLRRRLGRVGLETVEGLPLVVLPQVFNPAVFRTGAFLARTLNESEPPRAGATALDLGTGTGVGAVFAARRGYRVTAVDVNPQAVRCARLNAVLNEVEDEVEVLHGDLFAPVTGRRFDLVTFNPPYFRGEPRNDLDRAWRGEDVLERFAEGLPRVLEPTGEALLILSSDGVCDDLLEHLRRLGFTLDVAARRTYATEVLTAWRARRQVS